MDTREEIINAALTLFAEKGFEAVSVRDVTKKAKVNLASVSYHFGNKEGLIQEATTRIMDPMNLKRIDLLKELIEEKKGVENATMAELLTTFLKPLLMPEMVGSSPALLTKLAAKFVISQESVIPEVTLNIYKETLVSYVKAFYVKLPHMTPEEIRERLVFTSGAALQHFMLAPMAAALTGEESNIDREALLNHIIDFTLNGFSLKK